MLIQATPGVGPMEPRALRRWASQRTRASSPAAWALVRALGTRRGAADFCCVYAYFRWADDLIDTPGRDPQRVRAFAQAQAERVQALVRGRPLASEHPPERALALALTRTDAPRLRQSVLRMTEALGFDARREPTPLSVEALAAQLGRVGDAYTLALLHAAEAPDPVPPGVFALARAATGVHHLRDLRVDLGLGYLNLPAAHAQAHGIRPESFTEAELLPYRLARAPALRAEFAAGLAALGGLGSWRARWLLRAFAWRYLRTLERLTRDPDPEPEHKAGGHPGEPGLAGVDPTR